MGVDTESEGMNMRDWADDPTISIQDADRLNELDKLRIKEPILHAMVFGLRTVPSMALRIGWPYDHILWQLREYKKDGLVYDWEGVRSIAWLFSTIEETAQYLDLRDWVADQRRPSLQGLFLPNEEQREN